MLYFLKHMKISLFIDKKNLIILFTKPYVFQTKMRSSRPGTMVVINIFTKSSYIEQFLLKQKLQLS